MDLAECERNINDVTNKRTHEKLSFFHTPEEKIFVI